jgi:hypothetical protein
VLNNEVITVLMNKIKDRIKSYYQKKYVRNVLIFIILGFAVIGFGLTAAFFAVKLHLTDDPGNVDYNDRYYQAMADKYDDTGTVYHNVPQNEAAMYYKIAVLYQFAPLNAQLILKTYNRSKNILITEKMFDAINIYMKDNRKYFEKLEEINQLNDNLAGEKTGNFFEWMNMFEWEDFKDAIKKDAAVINKVGLETGVEPRLIAAMVVGEQIRLFDSEREAYKKWIGPLKILSVETQFSWGVTGIKPETAIKIEKYLKDSSSVFYIGNKYKHLLDFKTKDTDNERFNRITDWHNHYYSYLYAAINLKMIKTHWEKFGYDVSNRPEILATIFNLGFEISKPKASPRVGGSNILVKGKRYTFGALAYEFYYSGELLNEFPFLEKHFF